jgi:hypothetical protein
MGLSAELYFTLVGDVVRAVVFLRRCNPYRLRMPAKKAGER